MNNVIAKHLGMSPESDLDMDDICPTNPDADDDSLEDEESGVPVVINIDSDPTEIEKMADMDLKQTQEFVEKSIRSMMSKSTKAVTNIAQLAKQSDSPRAYEVLANMIKTTVDAGKTLLDIKRGGMPSGDQPDATDGGKVTQNNLFLSSDSVDDIVDKLATSMKTIKK